MPAENHTKYVKVPNLNRELWFATSIILIFVAAWGQPCIFSFWDRLWNPAQLTGGTGDCSGMRKLGRAAGFVDSYFQASARPIIVTDRARGRHTANS